MAWTPADISETCYRYPSVASCQSSMLAFIALVTQYFGQSHVYINPYKENEEYILSQTYDFIVVGAGSAGCVVANRLTEIGNWKVLLLEAGDEEPTVAHVPAFANFLRKSSADWKYETQPEPMACRAYENNVCPIPRGKVMGGSSTINGLIYMRGNKEDYNDWESFGNPGWSYAEVLHYFKKSEDNLNPDVVANNSGYHGTGGYLGVERYPYQDTNADVLINAFKEIGLLERDPNSAEQIGVGHVQVCARNGVRQSTNEAFITPIRANRPNLFVKTNAFVTRVLVDPRTKSAVGVEYSDFDRKDIVKRVYASKEVVLSAGAINTPKLLMLSGIGKAYELQKFGIEVVADLPVGENLHDHVTVTPLIGVIHPSRSTVKTPEEITNDAIGWLNSYTTALSGTGSLLGVAAFVKTSREPRPDVPDVQYFIRTTVLEDYMKVANNFQPINYLPTAYYNAISFGPHLLNTKSRGFVRLNETDPIWGPPLIHSNFFTHPEDLAVIVEGSMIARQIFETDAFKYNGITQYRVPQEACRHLEFDSPEYYACVAVNYSRSGDHSVGTCKMGPVNDPGAVVDARLRVYGVRGLRVVDASIIPTIPRGNINAPVIMIGEKGSDLIKEDWINPPERY
ncbi:glucose dehydrogenase [FAD, quinone]-like [Nasonia vitripennis]|uniref:Glucose-methanol-choline oxidoreductase N-terminal domain-containing protein n=1 Tax=Nasonia vitripennis TaxID=7425 RepID=A0A7M7QGX8_NASVI|nr:glucose dehydrogenase [FAD, quinone]-like [Nasonia vitripennis]